ncbi:MAG: hypothetical protein WC299_01200 [Kiritimatiellia bacterium]
MEKNITAGMKMTPKQREQALEFCRLAADWYLNNQNNERRPWGGIGNSADQGRFLYQYTPVTGECRGNGVWGQGVGIMGLLALAKRLDWAGEPHRTSAFAAAKYLMSLQILDARDERLFGALREGTPQTPWIFPRDGATGAMAFCQLYRETKEEEYLYRARIFADWFIRVAMGKKAWPCWTYHFDKLEADRRDPALWQAGAGLMFYYLHRLTGEKRYLREGLQPIMETYKKIYDKSEEEYATRTDDFAAIAALGACLLKDDRKLLECVRRRVKSTLASQDADGSCPGLAAEYIAGLTWHNFCQFVRSRKLKDRLAPCEQGIARAAAFAPTIQERDPRDIRAYGGLYGQSTFGVSRGIIHHRTTGYALIFMLRTESGTGVTAYNIFGW